MAETKNKAQTNRHPYLVPGLIGVGVIVVIITGIVLLSNNMGDSDFSQGGVEVEVLAEGSGPEAESGDELSMHYTGMLEDGTKFDSSHDRGQPFIFTLGAGQVIRGWEVATEGMRAGEKRRLTIPPELGYGEQGIPGTIPPNATLIFEVELVEIVEDASAQPEENATN